MSAKIVCPLALLICAKKKRNTNSSRDHRCWWRGFYNSLSGSASDSATSNWRAEHWTGSFHQHHWEVMMHQWRKSIQNWLCWHVSIKLFFIITHSLCANFTRREHTEKLCGFLFMIMSFKMSLFMSIYIYRPILFYTRGATSYEE